MGTIKGKGAAALMLVAMLFAGALSAQAADNEQIRFQGRLLDNTGNPITVTTPVEFNMYTAPTGGTAVWTESHSITPSASGVFTVLLGSTTDFSGVNFSQALYIGVTVDADPEMTPRYLLSSSSLAHHALSADSLGGLTSGDFAQLGAGTVTFTGDVVANSFTGDGSGLTNLTAANLTGALPAIDGSALTNLNAAALTGALPAIDGSALTNLTGGNVVGTVANATTAVDFTGTLAGEVTGLQGNTAVTNAVSTNTVNAIIRRDGSGGFAAGPVTIDGAGPFALTVNGQAQVTGPLHTSGPFHITGATPVIFGSGTASASNLLSNATTNQNWNLPDQSGTIALTADITGGTLAGSFDSLTVTNTGTFGGLLDGNDGLLISRSTTGTPGTIGSTLLVSGDADQTFGAFAEATYTGASVTGDQVMGLHGLVEIPNASAGILAIGTGGQSTDSQLGDNVGVHAWARQGGRNSGVMAVANATFAEQSTWSQTTLAATGLQSAAMLGFNNGATANDYGLYVDAANNRIVGDLTVTGTINATISGTAADSDALGGIPAASYYTASQTDTAIQTEITALNLGSMSTQDASSVNITGGTLDATTITNGTYSGNGAGLTDLDAGAITTGTLSGNFIAGGTFGAVDGSALTNLTGANVSGTVANATTAANFSGTLTGDVTGTQGATVVSLVGGVTAANVASGANLANAATDLNTVSAIVRRDASGDFAAGTITASFVGNLTGNADTATAAGNFTGTLAGDVTGTQGATVVSNVPDTALSGNVTLAGNTFNNASQLVQLDGTGALPALNGSNLSGLTAGQIGGLGALATLSTVGTTEIDDASVTQAKLGFTLGSMAFANTLNYYTATETDTEIANAITALNLDDMSTQNSGSVSITGGSGAFNTLSSDGGLTTSGGLTSFTAPLATPTGTYTAHDFVATVNDNQTNTSHTLRTLMTGTNAGTAEVTGAWLEAISDGAITQGAFGQAVYEGGTGGGTAIGLDGRARSFGAGPHAYLGIGTAGRADDTQLGSNIGVHAWARNGGKTAGIFAVANATEAEQQTFDGTLPAGLTAAVLGFNNATGTEAFGLYVQGENNFIDGDLTVTGTITGAVSGNVNSGDIIDSGDMNFTNASILLTNGNVTLTNGIFTGNGSNLTNLDAGAITTGTLSGSFITGGTFGAVDGGNLTNVDAATLQGATWAAPGAIGTTTPGTGVFSTLSSTGSLTVTGGNLTVGGANFSVDVSNGNLTTLGGITAGTINTGPGSTEVHLMNQNIQTTDSVTFVGGTFTGAGSFAGGLAVTGADLTVGGANFTVDVTNGNLTTVGGITAGTINTGPGSTEVHLMNQNIRTTDTVTFAGVAADSVATNPGNDPANLTNVPHWIRVSGSFTGAADGTTVVVATLPAGAVVHGVKVKSTTQFTGGTGPINLSVEANSVDLLTGSADFSAAVGDTLFEISNVMGSWDQGATTNVELRMNNGGGTTSGDADVWLLVSVTQ